MKSLKFISKMIALSLVVAACNNQSSDPLKEYKEQGLVIAPKSDVQSETQTTIIDPFVIKLEGSNQVNNGNFIADEEGQVQVFVRLKSNLIQSYNLVINNFTGGNDIILTPTSTPHVFLIKWTPKSAIIPAGKIGQSFTLKLQARVTDDGALKGIVSGEKEFILNVTRNNTTPAIIGKTDLSNGIDEGQKIKITVDVDDPASLKNPRLPELLITPYAYSNTEAFKADASKFISLDEDHIENPKRGEGSKWRFFLVLSAETLPIDRDRKGALDVNSNQVEMCFYVRAISAIGTQSIQEQVCLKGRYAVQTAGFEDLDTNLIEVKSKEEVSFKFKATTGNGLSKISFPKSAAELKALTGVQRISCEEQEGTICEVRWTPSCSKTQKKVTLKLTAKTQLNNKAKTSKFTKAFTILADPNACKGGVK